MKLNNSSAVLHLFCNKPIIYFTPRIQYFPSSFVKIKESQQPEMWLKRSFVHQMTKIQKAHTHPPRVFSEVKSSRKVCLRSSGIRNDEGVVQQLQWTICAHVTEWYTAADHLQAGGWEATHTNTNVQTWNLSSSSIISFTWIYYEVLLSHLDA